MHIAKRNTELDVLTGTIDIIDTLPNAHYDLSFGAFGRIFLSEIPSPIFPEKIYSNDKNFIEHVLKTSKISKGNLGIALFGNKGLGKSFTANLISTGLNLPVIHITGPTDNSGIFSFLRSITQDFVLQIDEFEKSFNITRDAEVGEVSQEEFLSFLDNGTVRENRIVFIITGNNATSLNGFLKNRPSRIRYFKNYDELSYNVIQEIVDDLLINEEHKEDLLKTLKIKELNIDVLIQIINEINIHDVPYSSFHDFFNYSTLGSDNSYTAVMLSEDKKEIPLISPLEIHGDFVRPGIYLGICPQTKERLISGLSFYIDERDLSEVYTIYRSTTLNNYPGPKEEAFQKAAVSVIFKRKEYILENAYKNFNLVF